MNFRNCKNCVNYLVPKKQIYYLYRNNKVIQVYNKDEKAKYFLFLQTVREKTTFTPLKIS